MRPVIFSLCVLLLCSGLPVIASEQYSVVINHEEQYSIWPTERKTPTGWKAIGFVGNKKQALRYIEEVWTDMRPLSSRRETALKMYQEMKQGK